MDMMRDEGLPPSMQRPAVGDHAAAVNLVCGILAALRLRDADGVGRYPVAGDRWLLLVMIEPDRYWPKLCAALSRPDLLADPRFEGGWKRSAHSKELADELGRTFLSKTLDEWRPILDAAGLIWAPVLRIEEAIQDPQARAMGYFYQIEHPTAGRFETVSPPFRIAGTPLGVARAASPLGVDAREVLREAGLDEGEIEKLV